MFGENHAHVILDGIDYKKAIERHKNGVDENYVRSVLKSYADAHIPYVRDGGDALGVSEYAKKIAAEYGLGYYTPVFAIHKKGLYGSVVGLSFSTISEYRALVKQAKERGADFIKIMTTGILDFSCFGKISSGALEKKEIADMVNIAHGEGFSVMSHTNGAENVLNAVEAGVDSIEHGYYIDDEALSALKESGCVWVPTLATCRNLLGECAFDGEALNEIVSSHEANIKKALSLGVFTALGSDAGAHNVTHPKGIIDEYNYFKEIAENGVDAALSRAQKALLGKFGGYKVI